jgi:hypothetical protein
VSAFWREADPGCGDVGAGFIARQCAFVAPARAQLAVARMATDSAIMGSALGLVFFI